MGTERDAVPVKLVSSILTGDLALLGRTRSELCRLYGPTDLESEIFPFEHTDYYAAEFGRALQRQIVSFERLIDPAELPTVKRQTDALERAWGGEQRRRVNIDPGYVALGKLVLASTKDHAHRLYLGQGVYGEVTLVYQRGAFRPWPWTYPDYASEPYCILFGQIRQRYKAQLSILPTRR